MRAGLLVALALAYSGVAQAGCENPATGLTINEFLVDPDGADSTALAEWVELYNGTSSTLELDGVELRKATQGDSYGVEATIEVGVTLAPGAYYVIGEANVSGADLIANGTMGLGSGSNGDGVRLTDCDGTVLDTVVYGDASNDQLVIDDSGEVATSLAPRPGTGETVARRQDGVDTDASGDDFWVPFNATRGTSNPSPPVCAPSLGGVSINEFVVGPAGEEFVELFNTAGTTQSLAGWQIESITSSAWSAKYTFEESASIGAEAWLAVAEPDVIGASVAADELGLGSGLRGDGVRLVDCDGTVVDTVTYGDSDNEDGIEDDRGLTTGLAEKPGTGEAVARVVDGVDTDVSADDFFVTDEITVQARNPSAPLCVPSNGDVVINEFLANPAGADGDVREEWVELYNAGDDALLLDDWVIAVATSEDNYTERAVFPAGSSIPADGHLLLGELNVLAADVVISSTLGLGSGLRADGVRLIDCTGATVDTVVYGDASNEDSIVGDNGVATSVAPTPGDGVALARRQDGQDSDASGDDFVASTSPTPGAANPVFECFPSTGDVLINEVLTDPDGSDGDAQSEWVELFNRSGDVLRVDGWQLVFASNADDAAPDVLFPPESAVPGTGFFVVGDANAPNTDAIVSMSIGNGSGGDAIRLIDCEGTLVDVVVYGGDNEDGNLDENGAIATPVAAPGSDQSIARAEDGGDADLADDWRVDGTPSPGASNVDPDGPDVDVPASTRGCGNNGAPDGEAPGGCGSNRELSNERGCVTAPLPLGGFELLLTGLLTLRRRRRL